MILIEQHFKPTLQPNNFYNPFIKDSKIRELGNVLFFELCELHQKYNVLTVFLVVIKDLSTALADNA